LSSTYFAAVVVCIFNFTSSADEFHQFAVQDKLLCRLTVPLTFQNADIPNNSEFQSRNTKSVIPTKFLSLPLLRYLNAVDAFKP
jgi:hypothetical protein